MRNIWQNLPLTSNRVKDVYYVGVEQGIARVFVRCACASLSPFLCSLQVSLNLWRCFATPGAKEDFKIFSSNKKEEEEEIDRGIIVVDRKQMGKIYGLRETTLLNIDACDKLGTVVSLIRTLPKTAEWKLRDCVTLMNTKTYEF